MQSRSTRVRLLLGGAALAALVLVSSGCSDEESNVAADNAAAASTASSVAALDTTTTAPATTIVATVDPTAMLQQALAALGTTYHFTSNVVVNGAQTLVAEGDRVGDGSRLTLTSGGATVAYLTTPAGSWAQPEGGDWEQLDDAPATADPIAALAAPAAVGVLSDDGTSVRLRVTVSAAALGVGTDGTVDVEVVITNGAITEVDYSATAPDGVASVATTFGPVLDATPVAPPG